MHKQGVGCLLLTAQVQPSPLLAPDPLHIEHELVSLHPCSVR